MAVSSLSDLSTSSSSRKASVIASRRLASTHTSAGRSPSWGSAVFDPEGKSANFVLAGINDSARRAPKAASAASRTLDGMAKTMRSPVSNPALAAGDWGGVAGYPTRRVAKPFTQNRIRYALESFGACMLIITFLALAMFA